MSEVCLKCAKDVTNDDCGLQCEICSKWFHIECISIGKTFYNTMKKKFDQGIHWYCESCDRFASNLIKKFSELQEKQLELELKIARLEQGYSEEINEKVAKEIEKAFVDKVNSINCIATTNPTSSKESIEAAVEVAVEQKMKKIVPQLKNERQNYAQEHQAREVDANNVRTSGISLSSNEETINEIRDSDRRKTNIVIFKAAESDSENIDNRLEHDFRVVQGIARLNNVNISAKAVYSMSRIGKRRTNESDGPRPMLVSFANIEEKSNFMKNIRVDLMKENNAYKDIYVKHDMTLREREMATRLGREAKLNNEQNDNNSFFYKVRGPPQNMRIVKVQKRV